MSSYFSCFSTLEPIKFDGYEENSQDFNIHNLPTDDKVIDHGPTSDYFPNSSNLTSRSNKTCLLPYESSFQNNFLSEHTQALSLKTQNLVESISSSSQTVSKELLKSKLLRSNFQGCRGSFEMIDSQLCQIDLSEKDQFKADLRYEKKLKEYLDLICQKFTDRVAGELIAVANFIWNQYLKVIDQKFVQKELKNWAQNLVQSKFNEYNVFLGEIKRRCLEEESESYPNFEGLIKEFLKCYFVTVSLVIEQYFENPFCGEERPALNSYKRFSSDDDSYSCDQFSELQEDIYGDKKRKL